jgi:hypothetical protein
MTECAELFETKFTGLRDGIRQLKPHDRKAFTEILILVMLLDLPEEDRAEVIARL